MNHIQEHEELIDLGTASTVTRGGPFGVDDHRASLMTWETGLTED